MSNKNLLNMVNMPMPSNLSYNWNFGSLLGMILILQLLTGVFLAMHYCSDPIITFDKMNHIMRDVNKGWIIRNFHANGASLFFVLIYLHIGRGLYYGSFFLKKPWFSGVVILVFLMMIAFIGYVLPWGQMSFWGATVITNLLTAIPYIGKSITFWIWGGFSVDSATLNRFFSFHFLFPFILVVFIISHIIFLHEKGSNNPLGLISNLDKIPFNPFYMWKDLLGLLLLIFLLVSICFLFPFILMDSDNFIPANPMVTPPHIQPEWYFLFAYAILRSIPNKLGGVIGLFLSLLILLGLLLLNNHYFSPMYMYMKYKFVYWWFVFNFIYLTFLGACPVEDPFILMAQICAIVYFLYFIILMWFDKFKI